MCRNQKYKSVLEMTADEARSFLLKHESYANIALPPYYNFAPLLASLSRELKGKDLETYFKEDVSPNDYENVNHVILANKDGRYAWRRLELINPAIYVSLVHIITDPTNWRLIKSRFIAFKNEVIRPKGIPVEAIDKERKDVGVQISKWWEEVEQESIKKAIDYQIIAHTDITDCYSRMYTHSVAWAIHGKPKAKTDRHDKSLLGNIIDRHLQYMHYGQTNGIPQGSVLMDLIAELVLGYADDLLFQRLEERGINDYYIIRYRDDYRIFAVNKYQAEAIIKELADVLLSLGMSINKTKTKISDDIVLSSIKEDKLAWIEKSMNKSLTKHLLNIYKHSMVYPNSGSVVSALSEYYDKIKNSDKYDPEILISILANMASNNPRAIPQIAAVISVIFRQKVKGSAKRILFDSVHDKMSQIPNHTYFEIWLQRIAIPNSITYKCELPLCKIARRLNSELWEMGWTESRRLLGRMKKGVIDKKKMRNIDVVIQPHEVEPFINS